MKLFFSFHFPAGKFLSALKTIILLHKISFCYSEIFFADSEHLSHTQNTPSIYQEEFLSSTKGNLSQSVRRFLLIFKYVLLVSINYLFAQLGNSPLSENMPKASFERSRYNCKLKKKPSATTHKTT